MSLFQQGKFTAHSGSILPFKIDCDHLSDEDVATLASIIGRRWDFGRVLGVPEGGLRLAGALQPYVMDGKPTLIVDDVLTTGRSMEEFGAKLGEPDSFGVVIFARGPCDPWIHPLFQMPAWSWNIVYQGRDDGDAVG